jgi:hypothetical protein
MTAVINPARRWARTAGDPSGGSRFRDGRIEAVGLSPGGLGLSPIRPGLGSPALSMKTVLFRTGTIENPLDKEDRIGGRWRWITGSAGEPRFVTRVTNPISVSLRENRVFFI